jgi:hypothetical protein
LLTTTELGIDENANKIADPPSETESDEVEIVEDPKKRSKGGQSKTASKVKCPKLGKKSGGKQLQQTMLPTALKVCTHTISM